MRARSARRSGFEIGSEWTQSAVRRATPSGTLVAHIRPLASPTMISRLPPPRSKHTAGAGSSTTEARSAPKIRRASSWPPMTSTCTPVSARMRSTSSPPFEARRMALVALARISVAPAASARRRNRRTVATAWSAAVGGMTPRRLTTSPRRSISFSWTNGSMCPSACTSATRRWKEFDPRSMAATRIAPTLREDAGWVGHVRRSPRTGLLVGFRRERRRARTTGAVSGDGHRRRGVGGRGRRRRDGRARRAGGRPPWRRAKPGGRASGPPASCAGSTTPAARRSWCRPTPSR